MYALGVRSEEDIRTYGSPISAQEILYALRQFGLTEATEHGIPKIEIDHLLQKHKEKLKYVLFYRYSEAQKSKIKEKVLEYQTIYESADWIVYDLTKKETEF